MDNYRNYKTKETYNVLDAIFNLQKITPDGNLIVYKIDKFFNKKLEKPLKEDEIIHDFQNWGVLKIEDKYVDDGDLIYYLKILPKFKKVYKDYYPDAPDIPNANTFNVSNAYLSNTYNNASNTLNTPNKDNSSDTLDSKDPYKVKSLQLNESQYLLEINNGEKFISFKSKKGKEGLEKETKLFKILCHLWEFRTEFKNNKRIIGENDWAT
ncbi:MAG: hypothetical protein PHQ01_02110, partial [Candidatus Pacebacteria bacterium]|nr:hypothetical protein [Candidatus Paceibacterota bacterium]